MEQAGESYLEPVPSPRNSAGPAGDRISTQSGKSVTGAGGLAPHNMHDYEEMPGLARHRVSGMKNPENGLSSIVENNNASGLHPYYGIHRKRINPLYDTNDNEEELLVGRKQSSWSFCDCPCLGVIFLTVISVIALVVSLLLASGVLQPMSNVNGSTAAIIQPGNISQQKLMERLQQIENDYIKLKSKVKLLGELDDKVTQVENKFSSWKTQVSDQLSTISKMPGPQGPQGPAGGGDMSKCVFNRTSRGTHIAVTETVTNWFPTGRPDLTDWVVTGVSCSTDVGTSMTLKTNVNNYGTQYQCVCKGRVDTSTTSRYCYMFMWRCPKQS